jgi:lysozyme family protein
MYWDAVRGDILPSGLDYAVFDAAVNSGPRRAIEWLQSSVSAKPDGIFGLNTLTRVEAVTEDDGGVLAAIGAVCRFRLHFLKGLGTWSTFGRGWQRRVEEVEKAAADLWRLYVDDMAPAVRFPDPAVDQPVPGVDAFCRNCGRFAGGITTEVGSCRRYAAISKADTDGWPTVLADDWCWEWIAKSVTASEESN